MMLKRLVIVTLLLSLSAWAERPVIEIEIRNHLFFPAEIEVPSNTKVKLKITNYDNTPEEFDSFDLNREKVIFPKRSATIFIGPLSPGHYYFFGEYNPNSAQGVVIVKGADNAD